MLRAIIGLRLWLRFGDLGNGLLGGLFVSIWSWINTLESSCGGVFAMAIMDRRSSKNM